MAVSGVVALQLSKARKMAPPECKGGKALVCADSNEHDHDVVADNAEGDALKNAVDHEAYSTQLSG